MPTMRRRRRCSYRRRWRKCWPQRRHAPPTTTFHCPSSRCQRHCHRHSQIIHSWLLFSLFASQSLSMNHEFWRGFRIREKKKAGLRFKGPISLFHFGLAQWKIYLVLNKICYYIKWKLHTWMKERTVAPTLSGGTAKRREGTRGGDP